MSELGMTEQALGARLGHASPESTRKYVQVSAHEVLADYRKALFGDEVAE
jgi:integrase/recombinase XerD